jgi:hypothetical protein
MADCAGVVVIPCAEQGRWSSFLTSLCGLGLPAGWSVLPVHGSSPASNANVGIAQALDRGAAHVLLLDDDLVLMPYALTRLLARNVDAVVGLSFLRKPPFSPIWMHTNSPMPGNFIETPPKGDALVPLAAGTAGGLLVGRRALELVGYPWFTLGQIGGALDQWNNDLWFCQRLTDVGIQLWGDPTVRFGHTGSMEVWPHVENGTWSKVLAVNGVPFAVLPWNQEASEP